jgi:hypothetical protein
MSELEDFSVIAGCQLHKCRVDVYRKLPLSFHFPSRLEAVFRFGLTK